MPKDFISLNIEDSGVEAKLGKFARATSTINFRQSLLDSALVMERDIKKELNIQVYSKPQTWYKRKKGAGLFGATQATGEIDAKGGSATTGVRSNKSYAVYVQLGTGIYASDGKGRKTPWTYQDERGNFHRTVGVRPKPYMTEGAKRALPKVLKVMTGFIKTTGGK